MYKYYIIQTNLHVYGGNLIAISSKNRGSRAEQKTSEGFPSRCATRIAFTSDSAQFGSRSSASCTSGSASSRRPCAISAATCPLSRSGVAPYRSLSSCIVKNASCSFSLAPCRLHTPVRVYRSRSPQRWHTYTTLHEHKSVITVRVGKKSEQNRAEQKWSEPNRREIDGRSCELRQDRVLVSVLHALQLASREIHAIQPEQCLHYQCDATHV